MERRAAQDGEMLPNIGFSNMMRNYIQEEMNKKRDLQMQVDSLSFLYPDLISL